MWEKEKFYRLTLIKKIIIFSIFCTYFFSNNILASELQNKIIYKLLDTKTLSFDFKQKISDKEEIGHCFIKYPLLMKCSYENLNQKIISSNGIKVAIIKKKYKKIYTYPIKSTPLNFILKKEEIINLVKKNQPSEEVFDKIEFKFFDKKKNIIKIFFDKNSLEFKGWETKDAYSNNVSFMLYNLITNNQIVDDFFKIPQEKDL
jgi:outer membrane lipoprotein-sorting protein